MNLNPRQAGADSFIKKLHERPHVPLADWLRAPAHAHYMASAWRTRRRNGR